MVAAVEVAAGGVEDVEEEGVADAALDAGAPEAPRAATSTPRRCNG